MLYYNKNLKSFSRQLRRNMTDAEILLWSRIRKKQLKNFQFYRQKPIGNYIVDFYCPKAKLVIEVDGSQHYVDKGLQKDRVRDSYMNDLGIRILRFSSRDIFKNLNGVLQQIYGSL